MPPGKQRFVPKSQREPLKRYLLEPEVIAALQNLSPEDVQMVSPRVAAIMQGLTKFKIKPASLQSLCDFGLGVFAENSQSDAAIAQAYTAFQWVNSLIHFRGKKARHYRKRYMVKKLGLQAILQTVEELEKKGKIRIVHRSRQPAGKYKRYHRMVEDPADCGDYAKWVYIDPDEFLAVEEDESIIFYSGTRASIRVELTVIRGVAFGIEDLSSELYTYLLHVVEEAVSERRDVRPSHGGKMVQTGFNTGPRHAKAFGLAVSYTKRLDETTKELHDREIVAAGSLLWNLVRGHMPAEVINETLDRLERHGLPSLRTQRVTEKEGFAFEMGNTEYSFPYAQRAPPEFYLARGYTAPIHKDLAYSHWAFTLCVARDSAAFASVDQDGRILPARGGNFVDVTLRVIVRQAAGTLLAHDAEEPHGTTIGPAASSNRIMANVFTRKLADSWGQLSKACKVESGAGAGNETHDTEESG